ncbi:MAG: cysteine desulfurase [Candidatus Taylorbacteria bacterium]|nr:cysteine desulfurase [Candidatus Taylorbacteria bacterium]
MRKRIYMDYASTTPLDPRVLRAMLPHLTKKYGNPSSLYEEGVEAKNALDEARTAVAHSLQAHTDEIVFTSGGTEANNLALLGVVRAREKRGTALSAIHCITTVIEHSSLLECFREFEARGVKVDYVPVDENGIVDPQNISQRLRPETVLVSVGYVNNEIGTVQPIREIAKIIRAYNTQLSRDTTTRILFHTDACQAPVYFDCLAERLGIDLMTLDGHKMYGPKGVGCLYLRRGTPLEPQLYGGGQERGYRSTTENVYAVVGFAEALRVAEERREKESERLQTLRDLTFSEIEKKVPQAVLNGDRKKRTPNNINISLPGVDTEFAVLKLDVAGIACSTKSSCLGTDGASYVVRALGGDERRAVSTLRFSFGGSTTKKDVGVLVREVCRLVQGSE